MKFLQDIFSNFFALVFGLVGIGLILMAILGLFLTGSLFWSAVYGVGGLVFIAISRACAKRG